VSPVRLTTVADAEAVAARAADVVQRLLGEALDARGIAHLALAGGSTPRRSHELLAERVRDWSRIHIWLSDERAVPPDDEESNFRMVRESLLDRVEIPPENVHRPLGERGAEEAADAYEAELRAAVDESTQADIPVLDIVMCGMGEDGHTLSLFPGHAEIDVKGRLVVPVHDAPKPPPDRISFTLDLVHAARRTMLLVSGASKADAMAAVLAGPDPHVPASLLRFGRLEVIADDAAAPAAIREHRG
jgi:6-phosphogluconolactonase